jgi:hypothetical protein
MKKILILIGIVALGVGCSNQELPFEDFDYQGVYFPYQSPYRTIILGDDEVGDNTIDRERAFSIGGSIGGMYVNTKDRDVFVEYAPELAANLTGVTLMPENYYTATFDKFTIPKGSFFGNLRVNLTDAFFEDPLTTFPNPLSTPIYVIPLRIIGADADSILSGAPNPTIPNPDLRIPDHWTIQPKNYVLFGVKYINPSHGVYFLRGQRYLLRDQSTNTTGVTDTVTYSTRFLTSNDKVKLTTKSLTENYMPSVGGFNKESFSDPEFSMLLTFDEATNNVTVSQRAGLTRKNEEYVAVTGTGKFYTKNDPESESYNEKRRRTIYLDYTYAYKGNTFNAKDTLVFIDTDVKFETFKIEVLP